jgi:hypothetical protein
MWATLEAFTNLFPRLSQNKLACFYLFFAYVGIYTPLEYLMVGWLLAACSLAARQLAAWQVAAFILQAAKTLFLLQCGFIQGGPYCHFMYDIYARG